MQSPAPNVDITVISGASTERGRKNLEKKRDGGKGETLSKPCIWTLGLHFAQRGQSPQEKHQVHGPHRDNKSCRNYHDNDHDNGSRYCEFLLLVYGRLFKCCH